MDLDYSTKKKVRVSHFSSKNIPINNTTKPQPQKIVCLETEQKIQSKYSRNSLVQRLNLAANFGTYRVQTKLEKKVTQPKARESKQKQARRLVIEESRYAAHPNVPSLEKFKNTVKNEAGKLRAIAGGNWKKRHQPETKQIEVFYREVVFKP